MTTYRLLLGLSADPVHMGHVEMVVQGVRALRVRDYEIAGVLLIPVYRRNPVGPEKTRLPDSFPHRLRMCRLAAQDVARRLGASPGYVRASAIEAKLARGRSRPNFTVETLRRLKLRSAPGEGLIFLISSELVSGPAPELARWHRPEVLFKLARLAVCPRPGYPLNKTFLQAVVQQGLSQPGLAQSGSRVIVLSEVETPDIASTELRGLLEQGVSPMSLAYQGLLPVSVARYLSRHSLYV